MNRYKQETGNEFKIITFYNGQSLLDYKKNLDIIFLDIKMPGLNGIQVAEKIRQKDQKVDIIFLTSLLQYAIEGYKVNAINYIVKPINYRRLKLELDNWFAKCIISEEPYIVINNDTGIYKIVLKSLKYIETYNRNLLFHTEKEDIISYKKLKEIEQVLADKGFSRCHNGYLVNLLFVESVKKLDAMLITGEIIPISKLKRKEFLECLASYWGEKI